MELGEALITGSGIRLGKEFAIHLAKQGYNIALHYNNSKTQALETQSQIKKYKVKCEIFKSDFSKESEPEKLFNQVIKIFPNLNILINSSSIYKKASIKETNIELFNNHININLKSAFFLSKYFAISCKKGNIINIVDSKFKLNQYHYASYLLSKKALAELTYLAALEFAPEIRVNAIAPGIILPIPSRTKKYNEWRIKDIPIQKKGKVENIIQGIEYIINNSFVNGQILTIDGGENINHIGKNLSTYNKNMSNLQKNKNNYN